MGRVEDVTAVVEPLLRHDRRAAAAGARTATDPDAWSAFVAFWRGDTESTVHHARAAACLDTDPVGRALALGAAGLARARSVDEVLPDPFDELAALLPPPEVDDDDWSVARYLAGEAALSCARVDRALVLRPTAGAASTTWHGTAMEVLQRQLAVRVAAFAGRIDDAGVELDALDDVARSPGAIGLAAGLRALVLGNSGDGPALTRALVAQVGSQPVAADHLGRGTLMLAAFGAVAIGDTRSAATLVLRAGGDADLTALTVIDRALGLELLAAVAALDDDVEAMRAWNERAAPLAHHHAAEPTVLRIRAREAALVGDVATAIDLAREAVAGAERAGRAVEAAEGRVVLARAQLGAHQVKEAGRTLRAAVHEPDALGHGAVRRSASQVLSTAGRRLPPISAGGWDVLSPREREVTDLVLRGLDPDAIARTLFLSTGTVRVHVSRILCAFGVGTRVGLLAACGARGDDPGRDPGLLTPRQREVVALVAAGHGNAEVAEVLGVSVKAVEKHVGDALRRWDVPSRFELARQWLRAQRTAVPTSERARHRPVP